MSDKVEWEIVDETTSNTGSSHTKSADAHAGTGASTSGPRAAAQAMLGPWWRWKLAAMFALGAVALVLLVAVAGVIAVAVTVAALVSFGVARVAYWLRGKQGGALASRGYGGRPNP